MASATDIKNAFDSFDDDQTGSLNQTDAVLALRSLGKNPMEDELRDYLEGYGDSFDFGTFTDFYNNNSFAKPRHQEDGCRNAFKILDQDNDGTIAEAELRQMLATVGDHLTHQEVDVIMEDVRVDQSGRVHYEDFIAMIINGCDDVIRDF
eukprot:TRINITY_DN1081_c0_g1_i1.p1 TRINITY_DN1081_c0_g1~~TRINITY_DN1081_c0_g1_i1.p1  ORF type:complete len:150 (-),score=49.56 TRINITY_DN1081_c0_g1_i1:38-487(-)